MPVVGDTLAGYHLEEVVGHGPTGVLFRARDRRLGRPVALRVFARELASDPLVRARVNRESTLLARLEHPNVVPLYAAEEADGTIFLASRWVDGRSLRRVIEEEGPLEPARAIRLVVQVAAALQAAHELGVVHRDLKPSNILITSADHVYITDFGLARGPADDTGLTGPNELATDFDYVAPEFISGDPIDARADVYGLGLILFEVLTGEPAFPRRGDAAKLYAHLAAEPPSVHERRPEVPAAFDRIIARALAKSPDARHATAAEFAREVVDACDKTRPPWALAREAVADGAPADEDDVGTATAARGEPFGPRDDRQERDAPPAARRWWRRTWRWGVALALVIVFLAAPAALLWVLRDSDAGPTTQSGTGPVHGVAVAGGRLWVAAGRNGLEARSAVDGRQRRIVALRAGAVRGVASRGNHLLVATDRRLIELPGADPGRARSVFVGDRTGPLAVGGGTAWAGAARRGELLRLDDGRATRIPLRGPASALAVGADTLWVADESTGTVLAVDPATAVARGPRVRVGRRPVAIVATRHAVWVVLAGEGALVRLDPRTGRVTGTPIAVPGGPNAVAADSRQVWVTRRDDDAVTRINARTGRPEDEVATADAPVGVALTDDAAWVVASGGQVTRIPR